MIQSSNPFITVIAIIAVAYALILVVVYLFQSRMIYIPDFPTRKLVATPEMLGMSYENVSLRTEDDVDLHGWFVPATNAKSTLLFFHGNAGNISHRLESIRIFHDLGLSVLIIDYRGYGKSDGRTSEAGTYCDARAAWDYLVSTRGFNERNIILFGRSLGGAIATQLATKVKAGALIVESTFSSAEALAKSVYWFLPVRLLARIHYPTAKYILHVSSPVLVIHSPKDEIVPYKQGRQIFDLAPEPKRFLELHGGHNEGFNLNRQDYINGIDDFLQSFH